MPHVLGAIVIGTLLLIFAVFVLVQFPKHNALRHSAWAVVLTLVQVLLGLVAYLARLSSHDAVAPDARLVISTVTSASAR